MQTSFQNQNRKILLSLRSANAPKVLLRDHRLYHSLQLRRKSGSQQKLTSLNKSIENLTYSKGYPSTVAVSEEENQKRYLTIYHLESDSTTIKLRPREKNSVKDLALLTPCWPRSYRVAILEGGQNAGHRTCLYYHHTQRYKLNRQHQLQHSRRSHKKQLQSIESKAATMKQLRL